MLLLFHVMFSPPFFHLSTTVWQHIYINLAGNGRMTRPHKDQLTLPHLDVCFGLVEQSQRGVPAAVWSQRDERLQPLQTQAEMCSSAEGEITFYTDRNDRKLKACLF